MKMTNLVLIGMPYVGKSTAGVVLAKALSMEFLDTDLYIQARQGRRLQEIIDSRGLAEFCRIEEQHVLSIRCTRHVIATGGSVVYSPPAMEHLRRQGTTVFLHLPLDLLEKRISHLSSRGVVMAAGQTLADLFAQRLPLYRQFADVTIDCAGLNHEQVVAEILAALTQRP